MDDRKRILLFAVIVAMVLSILCLILPENAEQLYVSIMHPVALLAGAIFAMQVSSVYTRELKKSFLFLSLFLLLYLPVNIPILDDFLISSIGSNLIYSVLFLQIADYAMLLSSCYYTVKVIDIKRMNRYGWILLGLLLSVCSYIVYLNAQFLLPREMTSPAVAIVDLMIVVIDQAVVLMLVPVLFLYVQYLKQKAQESVTFSFIMGGLILSLFSTYILELVANSPAGIQSNSILDAAYLFGYLLMAIGLYANRKYDEWGFSMIEKALR